MIHVVLSYWGKVEPGGQSGEQCIWFQNRKNVKKLGFGETVTKSMIFSTKQILILNLRILGILQPWIHALFS